MADEYVDRCTLECNGQAIEDFKAFKEGAVVHRKAVNLMHKTGFSSQTPRHTFSVDYVVPTAGTEYDFAAVENGRLTVTYEGGRRRTYTGVSCGQIGESTVDGENAMTRTIDFIADGMKDE
jgi:hypothetical protein